ncbi:arginine--tRNA ligase, chloroplastic/mitochondrial [Artemisia annua]|uniref:arginine--tRNA ligase n=1 Tax=Artemisia annua TaxID=35608 RepID=A0A2U1N142_ARTAN|nr:arginine--tRNA ligase, chloroplastic/mitochondrial [Artemisia annua]
MVRSTPTRVPSTPLPPESEYKIGMPPSKSSMAPSTSITMALKKAPSTSSTIMARSTSLIAPSTPIPPEFEWARSTSTPEFLIKSYTVKTMTLVTDFVIQERTSFLKWARSAAKMVDPDERRRLLNWAQSTTMFASVPDPVERKKFLEFAHSTARIAAPYERKRLLHSTARITAPDKIKEKFLETDMIEERPFGHTFVYLLNTQAKIPRITDGSREGINELKKALKLILGKGEDLILGKDEEHMWGVNLLEFTEALEESCLSVLPHILCEYLYDLSVKFNNYYSSAFKATSVPETSTLLLCEATAVVMDECFHLLGITPTSSFFELSMPQLPSSSLFSAAKRPMDVNASALPKIIKTGFSAINLIHFFTAGPDERGPKQR